MTPREFYELYLRLREEYRRQEYLSAMICAVTANCTAGSKNKTFTPADFMTTLDEKEETISSDADMLNKIRMLNAMMGGQDLTHSV